MSDVPVLNIDGLVTSLGPRGTCQVTAAMPPGTIVRLGGPSGSGKTTLLRTIARLQAPRNGRVFLDGRAAETIAATTWRRAVAYVPQRPAMLPGSVERNLRAGATVAAARDGAYDPVAAARLVDALRLPPSLLVQDSRTLSGGEAARVALARALLVGPRVLLLDECTAGLDDCTAAALVAVVRMYVEHAGHGALVVAHAVEPWGDAFGTTVMVESNP